jgi:hypothetical protein
MNICSNFLFWVTLGQLLALRYSNKSCKSLISSIRVQNYRARKKLLIPRFCIFYTIILVDIYLYYAMSIFLKSINLCKNR